MSLTTVPAVRAALTARFEALFTLPGDPRVSYGDPGRDVADRFVAVHQPQGDIDRQVRRLPLLPDSSVDEDYGLQVILWCNLRNRNDSDAQREAVEAVFGWADRIDLSLRTDQAAWTLDGLVTWCLVSRLTSEDFTLAEGRASQLILRLDIKAAHV